jgi:alkylhydroperoxidase family enzyme
LISDSLARSDKSGSGENNAAADRLFDKNEIVGLLMAICAINVWNRMAIITHQALPERGEATQAQSQT